MWKKNQSRALEELIAKSNIILLYWSKKYYQYWFLNSCFQLHIIPYSDSILPYNSGTIIKGDIDSLSQNPNLDAELTSAEESSTDDNIPVFPKQGKN